MRIRITPAPPVGRVNIPSSKSAGHRAVLSAALAKGTSCLSRISMSQDIEATLRAARAMGAVVRREGDSLWITGVGGKLPDTPCAVDCGESGSTLRFLLPLLAITRADCRLTGRGRLLSRPLTVYEELFARQEIPFARTERELIIGGKLSSGDFSIAGSISSQFITGLLFALPLLEGDSILHIKPPLESRPYVDMTMETLSYFGIRAEWLDEYTVALPGGQTYTAADLTVEGDFSQMAFFAVLGSMRGEVACFGLPERSSQGDRVILDILRAFGGTPEQFEGGWRFSSAPLTGRTISLADCPDLGPILTVLAAGAKGETKLLNAQRLRIKESDRAAAMAEELSRLGVRISCQDGTIQIAGGFGWSGETEVFCHNDHRVAMSLAVLGACGDAPLVLSGAECVAKSYPSFFEDLAALSVGVERLED